MLTLANASFHEMHTLPSPFSVLLIKCMKMGGQACKT